MASTTEVKLLQLVADGDPGAWGRWAERYLPMIWRWLAKSGLDAEDAEDVVQQTLIQVHRKIADFEHNGRRGAFRRWLRVITINSLRQTLRNREDRFLVIEPQMIQSIVDELDFRQRERSQRSVQIIDEWLTRLESQFEARTLAAFRLTFLDGLSAKEAAKRLQTTTSVIYIARSRVLKRLRELAQDESA